MQKQINEMKKELNKLKDVLTERDSLIEEWQAGISRLIKQLESHEILPVWKPKSQEKKK